MKEVAIAENGGMKEIIFFDSLTPQGLEQYVSQGLYPVPVKVGAYVKLIYYIDREDNLWGTRKPDEKTIQQVKTKLQ